ncbi:putative Pre-mRNA-splicing factor SLU7-A [Blattamonas nauphoetae]|uniref:Pre-mRNA-splicing factor SLU7 n=1 Tax=Blattamonas nauphoetae TaxID=2049346 RepID=A0ABQ9XYT5_9EUKA|nr:putative Pre-mRNA-splicing factor SLU7-A [Blattamonas nauphoetae]
MTANSTSTPGQSNEGEEINPHIPQFLAQAPWYLHEKSTNLNHQRLKQDVVDASLSQKKWYPRGQQAEGARALTFRKGACTNCGAMGHTAKECLDRPRAKGAKATGVNIMPDDVLVNERDLSMDYDSKRDIWNGYAPALYKDVMDRYSKLENERQRQRLENRSAVGNDGREDGGDADEDGFRLDDSNADVMGTQGHDKQAKSQIRNLRIREDTAKYLLDLDPNGAYYDPKSRAMRENPFGPGKESETGYQGDNFVRYTGETTEFTNVQLFAQAANDRGEDGIQPEANPSVTEKAYRRFKENKKKKEEEREKLLREKYGDGQAKNIDVNLIVGQSERYVEYTKDGKIARIGQDDQNQDLSSAKTKYSEDVYPGNHTAVWGSIWDAGKWGFACCHQFTRNAYCTGKAGRDDHHREVGMTEQEIEEDEKAFQHEMGIRRGID